MINTNEITNCKTSNNPLKFSNPVRDFPNLFCKAVIGLKRDKKIAGYAPDRNVTNNRIVKIAIQIVLLL